MTKKLLIFTSLFAAVLHGMEKEAEMISLLGMTKTSLSLLYNGTKINLIKDSWEDATDNIKLTIVGNRQQSTLQDDYDNLSTIGHTYWSYGCHKSIHKRKKDDDSASDDDTYKSYCKIDKQTWKNSQKYKPFIITIEEPCISNSTRAQRYAIVVPDKPEEMVNFTIPAECLNTFVYNVHRPVPNREDMYYNLCFKGDQAITEASKDLPLCYTNALTQGLKYFQFNEKKNKNIAFPTLGADVGFPRDKAAPIAIQAVFNFLQDNPNQYESINLFVKKRSEFGLYKKLLMKYYKPISVIYLLYWIHKDAGQNISSLPKELIDYIARLMSGICEIREQEHS